MLIQKSPKRLKHFPILVRTAVRSGPAALQALLRAMLLSAGLLVAGLVMGCGQQGPLVLPTEAAAANRATLTQTLRPGSRSVPAAPSPPAPLASPANAASAAP